MQSFPSVLFPTQGLVSIEETVLVIASELNGEICMRVIWSLLLADSVLFQRLHLFGFFFAVSPSISGSDGSSQLTVTEGSLVSLICESSGIPPPSLTWKKNGG